VLSFRTTVVADGVFTLSTPDIVLDTTHVGRPRLLRT
jgi:hypothetical protein